MTYALDPSWAGLGASGRVATALLTATPPSLEAGELTDKGSVSQKGVLAARAAEIERLYGLPIAGVG